MILSISIHAPRAGSDASASLIKSLAMLFQSTLPVRGATRYSLEPQAAQRDFNPRSPCGERLPRSHNGKGIEEFQSTLPVRGATNRTGSLGSAHRISIHAPRAGSDYARFHVYLLLRGAFQSTLPVRGATAYAAPIYHGIADFNPRSPCGERRYRAKVTVGKDIFQSTLPVRGAT